MEEKKVIFVGNIELELEDDKIVLLKYSVNGKMRIIKKGELRFNSKFKFEISCLEVNQLVNLINELKDEEYLTILKEELFKKIRDNYVPSIDFIFKVINDENVRKIIEQIDEKDNTISLKMEKFQVDVSNGYVKQVQLYGNYYDRFKSLYFCQALNLVLKKLIDENEQAFINFYESIINDKDIIFLADIIKKEKIEELNLLDEKDISDSSYNKSKVLLR